jgi:hypothetical protein
LLQQALAEVAEVAEAQRFRGFAAAEPLLKLAEMRRLSSEFQQTSAAHQQSETFGRP